MPASSRASGIFDGPAACGSPRCTCPNGNPIGTEKFAYKLAWMERLLAEHATQSSRRRSCSCSPATTTSSPSATTPRGRRTGRATRCSSRRAARPIRRLLNLGLTDALRASCDQADGIYSFWDYQAGAWQKNNGIRIDHLLLSPEASDRLASVGIDTPCARLGEAVGPRAGADRARRLTIAAPCRAATRCSAGPIRCGTPAAASRGMPPSPPSGRSRKTARGRSGARAAALRAGPPRRTG